jgi:RNA-directed DNA polymerase
MARSSPLSLAQIADALNLRQAALRAARGVRSRPAARRFLGDLDHQLAVMRQEILNETIQVGCSTEFMVYDPKPRRVLAPVFRERVLHHAIMAHVGPVLERTLVADTFACRLGKGTVAAVLRAQQHARRFAWYGQIDVRRYFPSVNHEVLLDLLERRFRDAAVRRLMRRIIESHAESPGRGLPIGSLCSQHFANFYLGLLDRAVLEQSSARAMVRYMDDLVLWGNSRAEVVQSLEVAERVVVERLSLKLRESPTINRVEHGLSFCGFRIHPGILRALPRRKKCYVRARRKWERRFAASKITAAELQRGYDSAAGILAHVDSTTWRRRQLELSPPPAICDEA